MDDLPKNVIKFTTLKINRGKEKHCTCYEYNRVWPQYDVDSSNREVTCRRCGEIVDPFDAIYNLAAHGERLENDVNGLYDQAVELQNYKPWLLRAREFERRIRGGEMIPSCPHCGKGILLDEMNGYTNKERELQRRKFQKGNENED